MDTPKTSLIKPFEELPVSTITYMVYSNININLLNFLLSAYVTKIILPVTKKRNIDKKKIASISPYGAIISLQYGTLYRGIRMSKKKKYWCPLCQPHDDKGKRKCSVEEDSRSYEKNETELTPVTHTTYTPPKGSKKIVFVCRLCGKTIDPSNLDKVVYMLNQVTLVLSTGGVLANIMIFGGCFKLAGVKNFNHAAESVMLLWEDYISRDTSLNLWSFKEDTLPKKNPGIPPFYRGDVHFLFEQVMMNVDFSMGFPIDKSKLIALIDSREYEGKIFSQCEKTSTTHVNTRMLSIKPSEFKYTILCYKKGSSSNPIFLISPVKLYYTNHKIEQKKYTTFITFSSSQTILSGRYPTNMRENYEFFVRLILENKSEIIECVERPKVSLKDYLLSIK